MTHILAVTGTCLLGGLFYGLIFWAMPLIIAHELTLKGKALVVASLHALIIVVVWGSWGIAQLSEGGI